MLPMNQKPKYALRKLSFGLCSSLIAMSFLAVGTETSVLAEGAETETVSSVDSSTQETETTPSESSATPVADEQDNPTPSSSVAETETGEGNVLELGSDRVELTGDVKTVQEAENLAKLTDGDKSSSSVAALQVQSARETDTAQPTQLSQTLTITVKAAEQPIQLNKLDIYKQVSEEASLTQYQVEAYQGDERVYDSGQVSIPYDQAVVSHQLNNLEANRLVLRLLKAETVSGNPVNQVGLREIKLYEFKPQPQEMAAPSSAGGGTPDDVLPDLPFEKPANGLGAITDFTFANGQALIRFETGQKAKLNLYTDNVFRYNIEKADAEFVDTPVPSRADRPATITIKDKAAYQAQYGTIGRLVTDDSSYVVETDTLKLVFDKLTARMSIVDKATDRVITKEVLPVQFDKDSTTQTLSQGKNEYFFGGGMQNGRFTHKGEKINIVNENNWVDGGVASPSPFYWSTRGYGVLRNTFKQGQYDFGTNNDKLLTSSHKEERFDAYYFVSPGKDATEILRAYYELTGAPAVLPEFANYLGHLNTYNRDYWVEVPEGTPGAVLLDGKYYREYQPNQLPEDKRPQAVQESLNGEKNNYKFSARAVIDRYKNYDMPISYFMPNDGYGSGYGQESNIDANIQNLKSFVDYAKERGIKVGLWTQSDLYDTDPKKNPILHRDFDKEVTEAGIRAVKTDVAWVGPGYSFGLNGVDAASKLLTEKSPESARPFIVSLDGWAGTQRAASIWSGDQVGGQWEYIRFHIPTYIGMGLSGNPNVGSDMDGIFGGADPVINAREYQWKTFSSVMMNIDGWGAKPKTPFSFDDRITDLNRISLKTKSTLLPYAYSYGHDAASSGKPIVRAMLMDFPDDMINYTKAVQYQYMYGDSFLVAPVYKNTAMKANGDDVRDNIYLPNGVEWLDFYTGEKYEGGQVINGFAAPLWKIPVFVKNGAIIPMVNANNNPEEIDRSNRLLQFYPHQGSQFKLYEDDGTTIGYKTGQLATTLIESHAADSNQVGQAVLTINRTQGSFDGFVKEKTTELHVNVSQDVNNVTATVNGQEVTLRRVNSLEEYKAGSNVFYYDATPKMDTYNPRSSDIQNLEVVKNPLVKVKLAKLDVTQSDIQVTLDGYTNQAKPKEVPENLALPAMPENLAVPESFISSNSMKVTWSPSEGAESYQVRHNGVVYSGIKATEFNFGDLPYASSHSFEVRAVNAKGVSDWTNVVNAKTSEDPWLNAIDIDPTKVDTNIKQQKGQGIDKFFNKKKGDIFHSDWKTKVEKNSYIQIDLGGIYDLDYLEYHQRGDGGRNGKINWATFQFSEDGEDWSDAYQADWRGETKVKKLNVDRKARYIYMNISNSHNGYISGEELLFFKKPGSKMIVPGDINNDGKITEDDKTSFLNYTGLRSVDNDFDYIKHVDSNKNGLIDAQDINVIATQLEGGIARPETQKPTGHLYFTSNKLELKAGEETEVTLMAEDLNRVNALTSTFKLDASALAVVGNKVTANNAFTKQAENFSNVKTRGSETDVVFTFVNFGDKPLMTGSGAVATVRLKALKDVTLDFSSNEGILVGNNQAVTSVNNEPVRSAETYNQVPVAPLNLQVGRETQGSLSLSWDASPEARRYIIEKEVTENGETRYVEVARTEETSFDLYSLDPSTSYKLRVSAVNPLGKSAPSTITGQTLAKTPSRRYVPVSARAEAADQAGYDVNRLIDGDENTLYHSDWENPDAVPSSLVLDMGKSVNLDHLVYVPRPDAGNGTVIALSLEVSEDGVNYTPANKGKYILWDYNNQDKVALFNPDTKGRFVKINWLGSLGGFISGQEVYVMPDAQAEIEQLDETPWNKALAAAQERLQGAKNEGVLAELEAARQELKDNNQWTPESMDWIVGVLNALKPELDESPWEQALAAARERLQGAKNEHVLAEIEAGKAQLIEAGEWNRESLDWIVGLLNGLTPEYETQVGTPESVEVPRYDFAVGTPESVEVPRYDFAVGTPESVEVPKYDFAVGQPETVEVPKYDFAVGQPETVEVPKYDFAVGQPETVEVPKYDFAVGQPETVEVPKYDFAVGQPESVEVPKYDFAVGQPETVEVPKYDFAVGQPETVEVPKYDFAVGQPESVEVPKYDFAVGQPETVEVPKYDFAVGTPESVEVPRYDFAVGQPEEVEYPTYPLEEVKKSMVEESCQPVAKTHSPLSLAQTNPQDYQQLVAKVEQAMTQPKPTSINQAVSQQELPKTASQSSLLLSLTGLGLSLLAGLGLRKKED
ncbi:discoidin domain-containing protein [Streptococcus cuniculipharyngis]|nr:discoidin domain-containing protein [Streptococcus cuniculipharyngis]